MHTEQDAEIIEFPQSDGNTKRKRRRLAPAQVIIFPGVRIERREYSLGDRLPRAKRKRASLVTTAVADVK